MTKWIGYSGLLLLALLWGTMVPSVAHLLLTWDPYFVAAFRYIGAVPLMWAAVALMKGRGDPVPSANVRPGWRLWPLGIIGIGVYATVFTVGVQHCHPVTAAVLSATSPAIAAIVDRIIFRLPIDRRMIPAILLAIIGSALTTVHFGSGEAFDFRGGEILIIIAMGCWSWYSTAAQRWCRGWSQVRITASTITTGSIGLGAIYAGAAWLGFATFPPPHDVAAWDWLVLAWVTAVLVAFGVFLWNFGVKRVGVVVASLYLNLVPVVAIGVFAFSGIIPLSAACW